MQPDRFDPLNHRHQTAIVLQNAGIEASLTKAITNALVEDRATVNDQTIQQVAELKAAIARLEARALEQRIAAILLTAAIATVFAVLGFKLL